MNPCAQAFWRLRIDIALSHNAPERGLNMLTRTTEPIVEVEMTERGVEVVAPKQSHDAAAEPDAFRIARRAADLGTGLGEFIDPALGFLCRVTRLGGFFRRLGVG